MLDILKIEVSLRGLTKTQAKASSFWELYDKLNSLSVGEFSALSGGAPRKLGRNKVEFAEDVQADIASAYWPLAEKNAGFYGRFLMAVNVADPACVQETITRGCDDEQAASIMALNFRKDPEVYKDVVVHACRTNSTIVHSAVSQGNPYPAKYFDDLEFKQLTIKTIFMGLDFDKIAGLEDRFNGDLGKSLFDFFEERRAAGRWLPENVLEFMKRKGLI